MVTLNKTWYIDLNLAPSAQATAIDQHRRMVYNLKQFLTGGAFYDNGVTVPAGSASAGAWTVQGSGNGAGTFGVGDNWTSSASIVSAATGVAHSWIVLRSPAGFVPGVGFVEILIDCNATGAAQFENFTMVWANSGNPFSIGTGTNLAAPTSPTNSASRANVQYIENTLLVNHTNHFWRNSEGDFWVTASKDGGGLVQFVATCIGLENGETPDAYPMMGGVFYSTAVTSPNTTDLASTTNMVGWWVDGTLADVMPCVLSTSATPGTSGFTAAGSGISSRYPTDIMRCFSVVSPTGGYRGNVPDIRWGHNAAAYNTLETTTDAYKDLSMGGMVLFSLGGTLNL
jgi:hypothetical protein